MVLMHRKDIIEQYGFDPGENSSVVPSNPEGPTAAIGSIPDDQELKPPSQEVESSGLGKNMLAGMFKSVLSDPAMLAGLGYGALYWGLRRLGGDKEAGFTEGLYVEGGEKKVQEHVNKKMEEFKASNPDMNDAALREAVEQYTATPEFFEVNTSQMIPPLRNGMRMAHHINDKVGIDKTPNQETFLDDTMQSLGGIMLPTGWLRLGEVASKYATKFAGKTAGKVAGGVGNVLDYTVVPGTAKLTPGHIAGNVGGAVAIDEAIRHATDDPTVLPSGEALTEMFKDVGRIEPTPLPQPIPEATLPVPTTPERKAELSIEGLEGLARGEGTAQAGLGTAAVIGGAVAGIAGARGALRGRVAPTIPPANPSSIADDIAVRREVETGLNAPVDPNPVHRGIESFDQALNSQAAPEQLGRELGIEQEVQAEMGQYISARGQEVVFNNAWNSGSLPDGSSILAPRVAYEGISTHDPVAVDIANRYLTANEIVNDISTRRTRATDELTTAQANLARSPQDPDLLARANEAQTNVRLWSTYDPSIRRYGPDLDEGALRQAADINNVPQQHRAAVLDIEQRYRNINQSLAELRYRSGVDDQATYTQRMQDDGHVRLFEHDPTNPTKYDPSAERDTSVGPPTVRVHNPIAPIASIRMAFESEAHHVAREVGKRNFHELLDAADPTQREHRVIPATDTSPSTHQSGVFTYRHRGREVRVQTARPHVADAINQSHFDDGAFWEIANTIRRFSQFGMVHGAAAVGQVPTSLFYDTVTGYIGQRAGSSVGYISRFVRGFGDNIVVSRVADLIDVVDPTRFLAMGITGARYSAHRAAGALGGRLMRAAINRDGLLGALANAVGPQRMEALGARMHQHFWNSWAGVYHRFEGFRPHEILADIVPARDRLQKDISKWERGVPRGMVHQVFSYGRGINAVLDTVASLAKITHFAQNYAIQQARGGNIRVLAEQSRRYAGDMSAQPGNQTVRRIAKTIPFGNIAIQSLRYITHALTSRGAWDSTLVLARFGAIGGAMYASAKMIEEMGLTDWYYETLNDFERIGVLRVPTVESKANQLATGQYLVDPNDPDKHFYRFRLPQEISLFMGSIMYGLEQTGFLNRGSNRGNTSAEKDMLFAAAQTFNVGNIPAVNAVTLGLYGTKTDLTAGLRGRDPITDVRGTPGQFGSTPGGIPVVAAEMMKTLLGFNGLMLAQSLDAGGQSLKADKGLAEALRRGTEEGVEMFKERSTPTVPGLWEGKRKVYGITAMGSEVTRQRKLAGTLEEMYQNEFTPSGRQRGEGRKRIADPDVRRMLHSTHGFYKTGQLPEYQKRLNKLWNELNSINASKASKDYQQIQKEADAKMLQMRPLHSRMQELISRYNERLSSRYGQVFEREGVPATVDGVEQLVRKYAS